MAAGYLHVPAVVALLQGGANPEVKDRKGQSVLDLVDSLKAPMMGDPQRRLMLEKVSEILVGAGSPPSGNCWLISGATAGWLTNPLSHISEQSTDTVDSQASQTR